MGFFRSRIRAHFFPTYNELSLSMMSLSFLLIFFSTESLRSKLFNFLSAPGDRGSKVLLFLFFTAGLVLSLYHVFTKREKTFAEKQAMLFFAVLANAFSGIYASAYILDRSTNTACIFVLLPIWNIINCVILLLSYRFGAINERNISDENAMSFEVLLGFIIIFGIFVVCRFVFKLYWAITFSISVIYATSFSETLNSMFHKGRRAKLDDIALDRKYESRPHKSEQCGFCSRKITPVETPYVINKKTIVCKECYYKIQDQTKDNKTI